jgi:GT2 family glycosyltransferase
MDLSICIISLNSKAFLSACLDSVIEHTQSVSYELIVVDNGSTDGTQTLLSERYPRVRLIQNQTNHGFSKPMNQAFEFTSGDFILALNPDTLINGDCFSTQVAYLRGHPEVGITIPKVLNADGSFQAQSRRGEARPAAAFGYFLGLGRLFPKSKALNSYLMSWLPESEIAEVKAVSGSCMFIRRECWQQIVGFDEVFFAYQEDSDFCERARANGWKVMYVPLSSVIHYGGQGGSKAQPVKAIYEWHRSYFLFYRKHYAKDYFFLFNWFYYGVMGLKLLLALLKNAITSLFTS